METVSLCAAKFLTLTGVGSASDGKGAVGSALDGKRCFGPYVQQAVWRLVGVWKMGGCSHTRNTGVCKSIQDMQSPDETTSKKIK